MNTPAIISAWRVNNMRSQSYKSFYPVIGIPSRALTMAVLIYLASSLCAFCAFGAGPRIAWLDRAKIAREHLPPYAFEFETVLHTRSFPVSDSNPVDWDALPERSKIEGRLAVGLGQVALSANLSDLKDGAPVARGRQFAYWDGRRCWSGRTPPDPGLWTPIYAISANNTSTTLLANYAYGGFLDGRVSPLPFPDWTATLEKASRIEASSTTVTVNGFGCHVVQGRTQNVDFKLWVDGQHGFNLRQAEFRIKLTPPKRLRHLLPGHTKEAIDSIELWIRDVKLQEEAPYLPLSGVLLRKTIMNTGEIEYEKVLVRRHNVRIDSVPPDAFRSEFPDGVLVTDMQSGIVQLWQGGRLTPFVEPGARRRIDSAIGEIARLASAGSILLSRDFYARVSLPAAAADTTLTQRIAAEYPSLDPVAPRADLYCLYVALRLSGRPVELPRLLQPEYVCYPRETSFHKLAQVATSHSLCGEVLSRLSIPGLRRLHSPVILHVKREVTRRKFDGYDLYLGAREGQALLFNPGQGLRREPFETLASRWDGTGLVLSVKPVRRRGIWLAMGAQYLSIALLGGMLVTGAWLGLSRWRRRDAGCRSVRGSALEFAGLAVAAIVLSVLWHVLRADGFLARPGATDYVRVARAGYFLPRIGLDRLVPIIEGKTKAVIVDARDRESYFVGHIPGAVNIPLEEGTAVSQKALEKIGKDVMIVTYCGSEDCNIARQFAACLVNDGFSNVNIYTGGWQEWEKRRK